MFSSRSVDLWFWVPSASGGTVANTLGPMIPIWPCSISVRFVLAHDPYPESISSNARFPVTGRESAVNQWVWYGALRSCLSLSPFALTSHHNRAYPKTRLWVMKILEPVFPGHGPGTDCKYRLWPEATWCWMLTFIILWITSHPVFKMVFCHRRLAFLSCLVTYIGKVTLCYSSWVPLLSSSPSVINSVFMLRLHSTPAHRSTDTPRFFIFHIDSSGVCPGEYNNNNIKDMIFTKTYLTYNARTYRSSYMTYQRTYHHNNNVMFSVQDLSKNVPSQ